MEVSQNGGWVKRKDAAKYIVEAIDAQLIALSPLYADAIQKQAAIKVIQFREYVKRVLVGEK